MVNIKVAFVLIVVLIILGLKTKKIKALNRKNIIVEYR
jgi:hypothetical protein